MAKRKPDLATAPTKQAIPKETAGQTVPAQTAPAPEPPAKPKRFPDKVQATLYLPKPVHKQMKLLAVEHETNVHTLVLEGIDLVLKAYGSKSIAQLTGKTDN